MNLYVSTSWFDIKYFPNKLLLVINKNLGFSQNKFSYKRNFPAFSFNFLNWFPMIQLWIQRSFNNELDLNSDNE